MRVIPLGTTSLPQDVIYEYLESLRQIYTPEVKLVPAPEITWEWHTDVVGISRTIYSCITAIISPMTLRRFWLVEAFRNTSLRCLRPFSILPLARCSNRSSIML